MDRFLKQIVVDKEPRLFSFTRMENVNGEKFFITSKDANQKPVAFSLRQKNYTGNWKLALGSPRWLYDIEEELSNAIMETRVS